MERTTMKRPLEKDLKQTIQKRNFRLAKFWERLGVEIDVIGDMETPAIIKGNSFLPNITTKARNSIALNCKSR